MATNENERYHIHDYCIFSIFYFRIKINQTQIYSIWKNPLNFSAKKFNLINNNNIKMQKTFF
jgi:hypothetical protein